MGNSTSSQDTTQEEPSTPASMEERFVASMVLSGTGDALGYKNGDWEFCNSGEEIHKDLRALGGLKGLQVKLPDWRVSDDTVMHLATAEALVKHGNDPDLENLYMRFAAEYKESMKDMNGRAPGMTCSSMVYALDLSRKDGYQIPFNRRGGGCGAAMRAMCIGLRYPRAEDLKKLIAVSVESGRMTHHHPTGYNGALAAALFVSFALQGKPPIEWGRDLMIALQEAMQYVEEQKRYVQENKEAWSYFQQHWEEYLHLRGIEDGKSVPKFPSKENDTIASRDKFYASLSFGGWGGASGHDSTLIAYDALLGSLQGDKIDWFELCSRAMFHSGDSDSTGVIAAACYGAMYGFCGVPKPNYQKLEYKSRLEDAGKQLYLLVESAMSIPESAVDEQAKGEQSAPAEGEELCQKDLATPKDQGADKIERVDENEPVEPKGTSGSMVTEETEQNSPQEGAEKMEGVDEPVEPERKSGSMVTEEKKTE